MSSRFDIDLDRARSHYRYRSLLARIQASFSSLNSKFAHMHFQPSNDSDPQAPSAGPFHQLQTFATDQGQFEEEEKELVQQRLLLGGDPAKGGFWDPLLISLE
jgi:hypothetical protein